MPRKKVQKSDGPKKALEQTAKPTDPEEIVDPVAPDEAPAGPQGDDLPEAAKVQDQPPVAEENPKVETAPEFEGPPEVEDVPIPPAIKIEDLAREQFVTLRSTPVPDSELVERIDVWDIPSNGALVRFVYLLNGQVQGVPQVVFVDNIRPDFAKSKIIRSLR